MSQIPEDIRAQFEEISTKTFEDQAVWMLNGFWGKMKDHAEHIWLVVEKFKQLDRQSDTSKGGDDPYGTSLDEFFSHKLLEEFGEPMTVIAFRQKMREIDLDFDKRMSVVEWACHKYDITAREAVEAPQGGDPELLEEARQKVDAAKASLDACLEAEKPFKVADEAAKAAQAELEAQQKLFDDRVAELEKKSEEGGVVSRNKAKNELEQMRAEDPLPLRRAKITADATARKCEKERIPFKAAVEEAQARMDEANAFLREVAAKGGEAKGAMWWLERRMTEMAKYMPSSKRTVKPPAGVQG